MTEEYLTNIVKNTLNIPVFAGQESIIYPAATLECRLNTPALFGDGKAKCRTITVYIDLWYEEKTDRDDGASALLEALDALDGITAPSMDAYYDTTAKKHRAHFSFETMYSKDEEPEPEPNEP